MSFKNVWVLEDEPDAQFVYSEALSDNYKLSFHSRVCDLRSALQTAQPDLLLADLRLPDGTFLDFYTSQDASTLQNTPVIVVSSVDDSEVLNVAFDHGAIDYLTKPFNMRELQVKIERVLSKKINVLNPVLSSLDLNRNTFVLTDKTTTNFIQLTPKEFQILCILGEKANGTANRTEIHKAIWGETKVGNKTLDVHLSNLRKKVNHLSLDVLFVAPDSFKITHLNS